MSTARTWWIDQPSLLASSNPTDEALAQLRAQGFRVLVSLLDEHREPTRYGRKVAGVAGWSLQSMPVAQGGAPSLDRLGQMLARLRAWTKGTKILIHCESGVGRAALIGAAYWVSQGLTAGDAMARIAQAGVEPGWATDERKELLRQWRAMNALLGPGSSKRPRTRVAVPGES